MIYTISMDEYRKLIWKTRDELLAKYRANKDNHYRIHLDGDYFNNTNGDLSTIYKNRYPGLSFSESTRWRGPDVTFVFENAEQKILFMMREL